MKQECAQGLRIVACMLWMASLGTAMAVPAELAEIEVVPAAKLITEKKVVVLDVREPSEYAGGHIAGSVLIPLGQVDARAQELARHKNQSMLVVCGSGVRSAAAIKILSDRGFSRLQNIKGGMNAWRKARLPTTR